MKITRRFFALVLALVMVLCLGVNAFADTTGKLTIKNSSSDRTYTLYKIFDATAANGNTAYKLSTLTDWTVNPYFVADSKGNVTATESATDTYGNLTEGAIAWIKSQVTAVPQKKFIETNADWSEEGTGKKLVFSNLPLGYYYVSTGEGCAVTIDSLNPNAVVYDKNTEEPGPYYSPSDTPVPYKTVKVGESAEEETKTTVEAGEKLAFTVTFKATNYETKEVALNKTESKQIIKYFVLDLAKNLKIDWNKVKVSVNDNTLASTAYEIVETVTNIPQPLGLAYGQAETNVKFIVINWAKLEEATYTNIYESPAKVEITYPAVMGVGDATNSVNVYYQFADGSIVKVPDNDPNPDVELSNHKVTVNSWKENQAKGILEDTEYVLYDTVSKKFYNYDSTNKVVSWVDNEDDAYVLSTISGTGAFEGLKDGSYAVKEKEVPYGYNTVADDKPAVINGADVTVDFYHNAGIELPQTGGIGTTIFYVFGGMLLIGAAVLLVVRRRMSSEEK